MAGMTDARCAGWHGDLGRAHGQPDGDISQNFGHGEESCPPWLISEVRPQAVQIAGHDPGTMAESRVV